MTNPYIVESQDAKPKVNKPILATGILAIIATISEALFGETPAIYESLVPPAVEESPIREEIPVRYTFVLENGRYVAYLGGQKQTGNSLGKFSLLNQDTLVLTNKNHGSLVYLRGAPIFGTSPSSNSETTGRLSSIYTLENASIYRGGIKPERANPLGSVSLFDADQDNLADLIFNTNGLNVPFLSYALSSRANNKGLEEAVEPRNSK